MLRNIALPLAQNQLTVSLRAVVPQICFDQGKAYIYAQHEGRLPLVNVASLPEHE